MNFAEREKIRDAYTIVLPDILNQYPKFDPYFYDWNSVMTPIEKNVWSDIRFLGCPVKCPQFPVANYFIDFADPVKRIGIEVDGKYHNDQREKDDLREEELTKIGWTIYRITGKESYKNIDESEEYSEEVLISESESERIINQIMRNHYPDLVRIKDF